jgi:uncharacterized protein (DUF433 family)
VTTVKTRYQWLETRPAKKPCQPGIRGRNMLVWNVVHPIVIQDASPADVARRFDLPEAAVLEALDYYRAHSDEIDSEINEIGRELRLR